MSQDRKKSKSTRPQEAGSIWTSFSDLFTSLAVIFLILFVFALLKFSVTTIESVKAKKEQEEYLEGKVTEKMKTKVEKKRDQLQSSLSEIKKHQEELAKRTQQINQLVEGLDGHKDIVSDLLKDQSKKDAALAHMREQTLKQKDLTRQAQEMREEIEKQLAENQKTIEKLKQEKNKVIVEAELQRDELQTKLLKTKDR